MLTETNTLKKKKKKEEEEEEEGNEVVEITETVRNLNFVNFP